MGKRAPNTVTPDTSGWMTPEAVAKIADQQDGRDNVPGLGIFIKKLFELFACATRRDVTQDVIDIVKEIDAIEQKWLETRRSAFAVLQKGDRRMYGSKLVTVEARHANSGRVTIKLPSGQTKTVNATALRPLPEKKKDK